MCFQTIRLIDELVDIPFYLIHLLVYDPHILLLLLTLKYSFFHHLHLLCMIGLHFQYQFYNNLRSFCILHLLFIYQSLIVLSYIFESLLKYHYILRTYVLEWNRLFIEFWTFFGLTTGVGVIAIVHSRETELLSLGLWERMWLEKTQIGGGIGLAWG